MCGNSVSYMSSQRRWNVRILNVILCQWSRLKRFPWLAYSKYLDGAFCLPCVSFGVQCGRNTDKLEKLYKSPLTLTLWTSVSSRFTKHGSGKCEMHSPLPLPLPSRTRERLRAAHDIGSSACFCRFLINSRSDSPPSSSHSPIYVLLWLFAILDKFLQSISLSIAISRLDPGVWRQLIHFGISRVKPTRRGTRGGRRRLCTTTSTTLLHRTNNFCATPSL